MSEPLTKYFYNSRLSLKCDDAPQDYVAVYLAADAEAELDALRQQLATMREVNDYDSTYQVELEQQLATAQAEVTRLRTLYEEDMGRTLPAERR